MNAKGAKNLQGLVFEWQNPYSPIHRPTRPQSLAGKMNRGICRLPTVMGRLVGACTRRALPGTQMRVILSRCCVLFLVVGMVKLVISLLCWAVFSIAALNIFVMSLMHCLHERYDHLFRFSIDNLWCNVCKCVFTNLKHCFMAFAMLSEKQWSSSRMYSLNVSPLHRPIFWICISEKPLRARAHAPLICNECVSILLIGIPLYSG